MARKGDEEKKRQREPDPGLIGNKKKGKCYVDSIKGKTNQKKRKGIAVKNKTSTKQRGMV